MLRRLLCLSIAFLLLGQVAIHAQDVDWSQEENLIFKNSLGEAVKSLRPKVAANPDDPYGYYLLGTALFESGDFESAQEQFMKGIDEKKRFPLNHVGMARVFFKQNKETEATEYLDKAMYYDKGKDINVKFAIARAYLDAGQLKDAEVQLRQAQSEAPEDPRSYVMLGDYEYAREVSEFALEQYEKAIEIDPTYIPAYTRIGELKINEAGKIEGDDEAAKTKRNELINRGLEFLNTAIEKDPEFAQSYQVRGDLMMRAGRYDQGREDYEKYLELTKNDLNAELNYGKFLFLSQNYQEAIEQFNSIDTVTGVKLRLIGMSYQKMGELDKAQDYMDQYFDMKEEQYRIADDYETYGRILLDKEELEKADEYFEKAIAMKPEKSSLYEKIAEGFDDKVDKAKLEIKGVEDQKDEAVKTYRELAAKYEELKAAEKIEEANDVVEQMTEKASFVKAQDAVIEEMEQDLVPIYEKEAYYRKKAIENASPVGLAHYYKAGIALYYAQKYEDADKHFVKAAELKNDYANIWLYRFQIAQTLEEQDTTTNEWLMREPAEEAISVWEGKDPSELSGSEKNVLLAANSYLAFYNFSKDESNDCDAAQPYVEKVLAISPDYSAVKSLTEYCDAIQNQAQTQSEGKGKR